MDLQRDAFHRAQQVLAQLGDAELFDAYKVFVARLEAVLGAGWLDTYAAMYQRDRRQITGQTEGKPLLAEEIALHEQANSDTQIGELYEHFIELLAQKKLLDQHYVRQ